MELVQDGIYLLFENVLDYESFIVCVVEDNIYNFIIIFKVYNLICFVGYVQQQLYDLIVYNFYCCVDEGRGKGLEFGCIYGFGIFFICFLMDLG